MGLWDQAGSSHSVHYWRYPAKSSDLLVTQPKHPCPSFSAGLQDNLCVTQCCNTEYVNPLSAPDYRLHASRSWIQTCMTVHVCWKSLVLVHIRTHSATYVPTFLHSGVVPYRWEFPYLCNYVPLVHYTLKHPLSLSCLCNNHLRVLFPATTSSSLSVNIPRCPAY